MAKTYTAPTTVNAGDAITASLYNTYVGTNVANLIVPPACRLTRSDVTQSIPNNVFTALTFDSEAFDTDGMHSTVSNTSRITINTDGIYMLSGLLQGPSATVTQLILAFYKNGTLIGRGGDFGGGGASAIGSATHSMIFEAVATDYFELFVYGFVTPAASRTFALAQFSAAWIGRTS